MNLNSRDYISRVVNLLTAFLRTSTDNPSHSQSAAPLWHKIKKRITILGICSMKTSRPVDVIISAFEVVTPRLVCAIDYSINHDF